MGFKFTMSQEVENPDPHFDPIVNLPPVQTKTLEEDEEDMIKLRAKLFRYDAEAEPPEWKERGTGDVKVLRHRQQGTCRLLMRRDKTHKICANHYVMPHMELKPNCGSERAWVWSTFADFADEEAKQELLAIRFGSAEKAQQFKAAFDEAKEVMLVKVKEVHGADAVPDAHPAGTENTAKTKDNSSEKKAEENATNAEGKTEETSAEAEKVADKLKDLSVKETPGTDSGDPNKKTDSESAKVNGEAGDGQR